MISSITNFLAKNRKTFYYFCFFLFIFSLTGDFTFADPKEVVVVDDADKWWKFAGSINTSLIWLSAIVWIVTYFITLFLEPGWINGTIFWLDTRFREIWILVSNVVYFIFAFLLIWIAFMNIIWKGQDKYQLKQALPKFIIWVLIVPFSWFFVQFILSISAILTVSALSLPFNTFQDIQTKIDTIKVPTKCYINIKSVWSNKTNDKTTGTKDDKTTGDKKEVLSAEEKEHEGDLFWCAQSWVMWLWDSMDSTSFGLISIYTYGILDLDGISKLETEDLKGKIETVWDLVIHVIFNVLFIVIYMVLIIALWLVLVVRWIYLWIYMMMSPVFWLMYFFDKNEGGWDGLFSKFNFKQLISLALVPVYVMLALSFGFLFIFVILNWVSEKGATDITTPTWKVSISETWIRINDIWWEDKNDFELVVKWALSENHRKEWVKDSGYGELWTAGLWIVWDLILKLLWVVVLWISIMSAMRASDITKAVVEPLHSFWGQVWWLIAKSPQYLPIFKGQSMTSMQQIWSSASSHFETKSRNRWTDFLKKHKLFGENGSIDLSTKSINALTAHKDFWLTQKTGEAYKEAYNQAKNIWELTKEKNFIEITKKIATDMEIKWAEDVRVWMSADNLAKVIWDIDYNYKNKQGRATWNVDIIPWLDKKNASVKATDLNKIITNSTAAWTVSTDTDADIDKKLKEDKGTTLKSEIKLSDIPVRFFNDDALTLKSDAIDNVARKIHSEIWSSLLTEDEYKEKLKEKLEDRDVNRVLGYIKRELVAKDEKLFKEKPKEKTKE